MNTCPNCAAANRADALVCYNCGFDLGTRPGLPPRWDQPGKTQPVHTGSSVPRGQNPQGYYQPGITRPMGPESFPPEPSLPAGNYNSSHAPPDYGTSIPPAPPGYYGAEPGRPARKRSPDRGRFWMALVAWLVLALLCGGGLAMWTLASAAYGGVYGVGSQLSTQAAQVMAPDAPDPTATPEPTWTPEGAGEPALDATQESTVKKLLSPECSGALDRLGGARDQLTSNPAAPFDAAWREELNQAIDQTRTFCGSLESASPVPGIVAQAQSDLGQAQSEFDQANRLFKEGVDEWNPGKIWEAGGHVASAGRSLDAAMTELRKIGQ